MQFGKAHLYSLFICRGRVSHREKKKGHTLCVQRTLEHQAANDSVLLTEQLFLVTDLNIIIMKDVMVEKKMARGRTAQEVMCWTQKYCSRFLSAAWSPGPISFYSLLLVVWICFPFIVLMSIPHPHTLTWKKAFEYSAPASSTYFSIFCIMLFAILFKG